jgi:hypothetical protein
MGNRIGQAVGHLAAEERHRYPQADRRDARLEPFEFLAGHRREDVVWVVGLVPEVPRGLFIAR